ncbi:MAG: sulfotransferase family protein [Hyphomicrobiaceae bacterium]
MKTRVTMLLGGSPPRATRLDVAVAPADPSGPSPVAVAAQPAPTANRPMDFVIGGVPRSGTTILSKIINGHELVYSYSSETNIFRHMWAYGRSAPLPRSREAEFIGYLDRDMHIAFREHFVPYVESLKRYQDVLRRYNPRIPDRPLLPLFDEPDIARIRDEIIELMRSGLWGAPLFGEASKLMGRWLREKSGRDIVGEKTPDNIISMPLIAKATPETLLICTFRDPMPNIRSMMNRAEGGGVQDGVFSTEFLASLGQYEMYARAICEAKAHTDRLLLLDYDALMEDPAQRIDGLLQHLGLAADVDVRRIASVLIGQAPKRSDKHAGFARAEVRIARLVLAPFAEQLGISDDLDAEGQRPYGDHTVLDASRPPHLLPILGAEPVSGVLTWATGEQAFEIGTGGTLLLVEPSKIAGATLGISCSAGRGGAPSAQRVRVAVNHATVADVEITGDGKPVNVDLPLLDHPAAWIEGKTHAHVVRIETSVDAASEHGEPHPLLVSLRSVR